MKQRFHRPKSNSVSSASSQEGPPPIDLNSRLFLKINANRAADLVSTSSTTNSLLSPHKYSSRKSINPVLIVQVNQTITSTSKKLNTNQPSWDDAILVPLKHNDFSQMMILTIWDKHKRYKNYLGELRLSIRDLFYEDGKFKEKTELKWYRLSSSESQRTFVTGSLLVSFELVSKRRKRGSRRTRRNNSSSSISDKEVLFKEWLDSLVHPVSQPDSTNPDEQGFYQNTGDVIDVSDDESDVDTGNMGTHNRVLKLQEEQEDPSSLSEVSTDSFSDDSWIASDLSTSPKMSRLDKLKRKRKKRNGTGNFEFGRNGHNEIAGVAFIEIVSCSGLPPIRNFTRTAYDMDPFVVVTFGKKTFRTSWKRHTLNPIFNERIALEVLSSEQNFNIQFLVLDKDHFSFHDNIARITLPLRDLTEYATVTNMSRNPDSIDEGLSTGNESPSNVSIRIVDDEDLVKSIRRKKFSRKKVITSSHIDTTKFRVMSLALDLQEKYLGQFGDYNPELKIRVRFEAYDDLRRKFWSTLLQQYKVNDGEGYDYFELLSLLDTFGCFNSDEIVNGFYNTLGKSVWGGDLLTHEEIINALENHVQSAKNGDDSKLFQFERCPICNQKRFSKRQDLDIITHFAICASKDWSIVNKLLVSSYVTPHQATKKWFTKVLIKLTYGKYQLGGNSANILVQDRMSGIIMEEKMSVYVRLGIRLLYKGLDKAKTKRIRILLRKLSIKQGVKFDNPQSKADIIPFIKFHGLNLKDYLIENPSEYPTFNEFFYRKLKPNARPLEDESNPKIVSSPADCRCVVFETVDDATKLWIKGRNFTIAKLFNGNFNNLEKTDLFNASQCSLGIFRLAPQDYHRFHSPVDGVIQSMKEIEGEYYTVNPMAIRSELDVYGENIRTIIPIKTEHFGTVIMIAVGAMMVGSTVLLVKEGDKIGRGDEVGYFKFGGSTILLLFEKKRFQFDRDLVKNSSDCVETFVRVGQSIGHSPDVPEFDKRDYVEFKKLSATSKLNLIRVLTGGDVKDNREFNNWEAKNVSFSHEDLDDLQEDEDDFYDNESFDEEGSLEEDD
ncbi:uncharacterized protein SPAPADRAFT_156773 [Spathaspora passalidarum NRRL Y-27907]|uniref:Phosphatidylserine decarboxylase proenzyme 2 n=1 Tax=Spathaspora passalidarum (strain NRRL Y-27907 / 11-Y1) TaxID=619300 RepID=G3ASH7_SPAPN|nr:uncharacterized protein SPAPADRAFT_156773 [Spathaspora passalidarum NRRL Y-27907]EGW31095.1 hypothetical protein SPAPADRAFT_156773 [Spathaspora passalidarum NRRL Y-27907]